MMKFLPLLATLAAIPCAAWAQKIEPSGKPISYRVGKEKAPIYRSAADTTGKASFYLFPNSEITTVGDFNAHWVKVKRDGFYYITPARLLLGYDPKALAADEAADAAPMPVDPTTQRYSYEGVVEVAGVSKDQLYSRALEWVAKTYKSAQAVIQMQDKESGKLVMKGLSKVSIRSYPGGVVNHTLTIYVKDGRYKYVLTDLTHSAGGEHNIISGGPLENEDGKVYAYGGDKKAWLGIRKEANRDARRIVAGLQAAMNVAPGKDPSDF